MLGTLMLVLFLCLFATVPIALSLGISTLGVFATQFPSMPMANNLAQAMITSADSFPLMAIPFFMLVGTLMEKTGIARRLVDIASILTGDTPGGLGMAAIVASMFFAAISGSGPATAAAIGGIMLPAMIEQRYSRSYSVGIVSGASIIGPIIPPSIPMIMYGVTVGVSVTKMFTAGFIPGFMLGGGLCLYNYFVSKKRGYRGNTVTMTRKEKINTFKGAIPAILMPVIVLGGIYSGIFTATEAGAVSCVYALIVAVFIYKTLTWKEVLRIIRDSAVACSVILFIMGTSTVFSWLFTVSGISGWLVSSVTGAGLGYYPILLIITVILLIFGFFLEGIATVSMLLPLFIPIAQAVGIDLLHLGMIVTMTNVMGCMTPPVANNIFAASTFTGLPMGRISKGELPYLGCFFVVLLIVVFCPGLITMFG